jgi:hypothetical protein
VPGLFLETVFWTADNGHDVVSFVSFLCDTGSDQHFAPTTFCTAGRKSLAFPLVLATTSSASWPISILP